MAQQWYYSDGKQVFGPVPTDELRRLAAGGAVRTDMQVCSEPERKWMPATQVKGLFPQQSAAPQSAGAAVEEPPIAEPPPSVSPTAQSFPTAVVDASPGASRRTASALGKRAGGGWLFDTRFQQFATPTIVQIIWVICLIVAAIGLVSGVGSALVMLFSAIRTGNVLAGLLGSLAMLVLTMFWVALGLLYARVLLEALVVLFRIHEQLNEINRKTIDNSPADKA